MSTVNLNNASAVYFGSRQVDRIYRGAELVWPPPSEPDPEEPADGD